MIEGVENRGYKKMALTNIAADSRELAERQVRRGLRSSLISIGSNFALATCKCVVGVAGHSFALIADGVESLSDVFSSAVVYLGLRVAIKPPDSDHPYGHGKAEPVAALVVGLGMAMAAVLIAAESINLIRNRIRCRFHTRFGFWLRLCL